MNKWQLFEKNNQLVKRIFFFVFSLALLTETFERFHYNSGTFKFSWFEIELFIFILVIFFNPKGVKLLSIFVLSYLTFVSFYYLLLTHVSYYPPTLIFETILRLYTSNAIIIYPLHFITYTLLFLLLFIKQDHKIYHEDLIDN